MSKAQRIATNLESGERYAGIILGKDGQPDHHLILLAAEPKNLQSWNDAKAWAVKAGGELPTRREQSLLFANLKDQFEPDWYWSCEQDAADDSYAWDQIFGNGGQGYDPKTYEGRARAVRRLLIIE